MQEPNLSSVSSVEPSLTEQASGFLKEMMVQATRQRRTAGDEITMSDGTVYTVQWNGSWKKTTEGLKGKARRNFEKAMAKGNV